MNPEIQKELEKLKIELDAAQARYDLASHFAGMDKPKPENFPDGWETEWQPSFDAATPEPKPAPKYKLDEPMTPPRLRPTPEEIAQLKEAAKEIEAAQAKFTAIAGKYARCFECGAWYGDRHDKDCDMANCENCGCQINITSDRGCKCKDPIPCQFEDEKF